MAAPIPSTSQTILANGLPSLPEDTTADTALIGTCTLGTPLTIYAFRGNQTQTVIDQLGGGPLVDRVIYHLAKSKGKTVYAMPGTVTAGSNTAVTQSGGGPAVTLTGNPNDYYEIKVQVMLGGALGTSTFRYSLDGGDTYSDTITTAATYLMTLAGVTTGVTLNFAAGTYEVGTTYTATSTAPTITNTNIGLAIDAFHADPRTWGLLAIVGQAADATDTFVIVATVQSKADTAETAQRYYRAILEFPMIAPTTLTAAAAAVSADRVSPCGGFCELVQDLDSRVAKRSIAWGYHARLCEVGISIDPSRNASDSDLESIAGVTALVPQGAAASTGYHDEGKTPAYNAARVTSMMTFPNVAGFFITNGKLLAPAGSDFDLIQFGRVMDRACTINAAMMPRFLSKRTGTDSDGFILDEDASAIEKVITDALRQALVQTRHAQSAVCIITRSNVIATTGLISKVRVKPWDYPKTFTSEIGFALSA